MIHRTINIGEWEVDSFFCITQYDESVLQRALERIDAPISVIIRMREIAMDDEYNTGFTYSNKKQRRCVMVVGKSSSPSEFINTTMHEVRHVSDDIAIAENISLQGENVGYLQGFICEKLSDIIGRFICPCCNKPLLNKRTKEFNKRANIY